MKLTSLWGLGLACALGLAAPQSAWAANPTLTVSDAVIAEGNTGTVNAAFQIKLSAPSPLPVTVKYATANYTATTGADYTALPLTTLVFAAGQTTKTVNVAVKGDTLDEADETYLLKLSASTGAAIADASGTGKIVDNDTSVISAVGASITEGNSGKSVMNFTLKLSVPNSRAVTVKVQTSSAVPQPATVNSDYTPVAAKIVTFPVGTTALTFPVSITGDLLDENDEKIGLSLSTPTNAVSGAITPGIIVDNDAAPQLKVNDIRVNEGNTGTINAAFTISLSAVSGRSVTVQTASVNSTAVAGKDYAVLPLTTLAFAPGQTSKVVNIAVTGDVIDELDEAFSLRLSNAVNAIIQDGIGAATIVDNDTSSISAAGATVKEGNSGTVPLTFALKLSNPNSRPVTVKVQSGTTPVAPATPQVDFTPLPLTVVTFAAGETSKTIPVMIKGDTLDEVNERVALLLSAPVNGVLGTSAPGTITDDDDVLPALKISDLSITEGDSDAKNAAVVVSLSAASSRPVTVQYATADVTAFADTDYTELPLTTLTIPAGQTSAIINVPILGNIVPEENEQFNVVLSASQFATLADSTGVVTITNDDNWAPSARNDYFEFSYNGAVAFDETLDVLKNDSDKNGDPLTLISVTQPQGSFTGVGKAQIVDGKIRVTCQGLSGNFGTISFDYKVSDRKTTSTTTVVVDFTNKIPDVSNFPPSPSPDLYNDGVMYAPGASYTATINVLANDDDIDGDALQITNVYGLTGDFAPGTASVQIVNNRAVLKITKLPTYSGSASFYYDVTDGRNASSSSVDVFYNVQSGLQVKPSARKSATAPSSRGF